VRFGNILYSVLLGNSLKSFKEFNVPVRIIRNNIRVPTYSLNQVKVTLFCPHEIKPVLVATHVLNYVTEAHLKNFSATFLWSFVNV